MCLAFVKILHVVSTALMLSHFVCRSSRPVGGNYFLEKTLNGCGLFAISNNEKCCTQTVSNCSQLDKHEQNMTKWPNFYIICKNCGDSWWINFVDFAHDFSQTGCLANHFSWDLALPGEEGHFMGSTDSNTSKKMMKCGCIKCSQHQTSEANTHRHPPVKWIERISNTHGHKWCHMVV